MTPPQGGPEETFLVKEGVRSEYERVTGALKAFGFDLVFCEECGVVFNYQIREDCPLCHWSGVVR